MFLIICTSRVQNRVQLSVAETSFFFFVHDGTFLKCFFAKIHFHNGRGIFQGVAIKLKRRLSLKQVSGPNSARGMWKNGCVERGCRKDVSNFFFSAEGSIVCDYLFNVSEST